MRSNRLSQRLKTKLDAFGFDALIQGVSTLVDEEAEEPEGNRQKAATRSVAVDGSQSSTTDDRRPTTGSALPPGLDESRPPTHLTPAERVESEGESVPLLSPASRGERREARYDSRELPVPHSALSTQHTAQDALPAMPRSLADALDTLGCRLAQEAAKMGAALREGDIDEAGFFLAHVNQILDLLRTIDPQGEIARQLGTRNAPPEGRSWPATSWSVVEFAESPFSALLPPDADDLFVRQLLYAAWGVTIEAAAG